MKSISALLISAAFSFPAAQAQTASAPSFDVASIKPAAPDGSPRPRMPLPSHVAELMAFRGGPGSESPNRIDYRGVSLQMLLVRAYG